MPQHLKSLHPQKIAVIRRNGIGDLLLTVPMLKECKKQFAGCHLTLVVDKRNEECAQWVQDPPWDELLILSSGNKYLAALKLGLKLRSYHLDMIISAKPTAMRLMNFLLALSGAKLKRAVVDSNKSDFFKCFVNWPLSSAKVNTMSHHSQKVLQLISEAACEKEREQSLPIEPCLFPRLKNPLDDDVESFDAFCTHQGFLKGLQVITFYINLTNHRPTSRLNSSQIVHALKRMKFPFNIVLGGMEQDLSLAQKWLKDLSMDLNAPIGVYLCSQLGDTVAALKGCDLVITGDGGLMHLAAACQCLQLALFGHTCLKKWRPLSLNACCLYHPQSVEQISAYSIACELERLAQNIWQVRASS